MLARFKTILTNQKKRWVRVRPRQNRQKPTNLCFVHQLWRIFLRMKSSASLLLPKAAEAFYFFSSIFNLLILRLLASNFPFAGHLINNSLFQTLEKLCGPVYLMEAQFWGERQIAFMNPFGELGKGCSIAEKCYLTLKEAYSRSLKV